METIKAYIALTKPRVIELLLVATIPAGRWLPYVVALAVTMIMHWWRRNVLLSIVVGTGVCVGLSLL